MTKTKDLQDQDQWLNSAGTGRNGVLPPVSGVPLPEIAVPPPCNDIPSQFWGKIIKTVATRDQILRLKCTKYNFGWDYSARPEPLARRGPTSKGEGGWEKRKRERIEEEKRWKGRG